MNWKMIIFEKWNPSLPFTKMVIFGFIFMFHFCGFFKLRSDAWSFAVTTINDDAPPLYASTTTTTLSLPAVTTPMPPPTSARTVSGRIRPVSDATRAQTTATRRLGSRVHFFCSFLLFMS
jgi:hypothetical protein